MRKGDIKPGVVYAIWNRNTKYSSPSPVVFLTAPADGRLFKSTRRGAERPFMAAPEYSRPKANSGHYGSVSVGYAVVVPYSGGSEPALTADELRKLTLPDFKSAASSYGEGYQFAVITSLAQVAGPWEEVTAEYEARERAEREARERTKAWREDMAGRSNAVVTALASRGVRAASLGSNGMIGIQIGEAEKLIAALTGKLDALGEVHGGVVRGVPAEEGARQAN